MKTTTTVKGYDLASIMSTAWAIRKDAAAGIGCKVSEIVFSECLRMAWAEAEGQHAEDNAQAIINEWAAMGEAGQMKVMTACVRKAAKNEIGYSVEDQYLQYSEVPAWGLYGHGFDEFVNETWLRLSEALNVEKITNRNERRAAQGKCPLTLISLVYNAARASISAIYYADHKHGVASVHTVKGNDGTEYSYTETMATSKRDNTETSAIIRADLERFTAGRDAIDQKILELLPLGYTEREIAKVVMISNVAVHKRITKMRGILRQAIA